MEFAHRYHFKRNLESRGYVQTENLFCSIVAWCLFRWFTQKVLKNIVFYYLLFIYILKVNCAHWNYDPNSPDGPNNWGRVSQNCDGRRQSPVNFDWFAATPILTAPRIRIQDIDKRPSSIQYTNNGHGIAVTFSYADGVQPMVTGGPLELDSYIFHSLHLHWDSEHTINGHHFPAETHLVHFNSKYGSLEQAIKQNDGLAVLGFLHHVIFLVKI